MIAVDKIALHPKEFFLKLPTKRLLNVYKKLRSLKNGCICGCGCCEITSGEEKNYLVYKNVMKTVKEILDTRENV